MTKREMIYLMLWAIALFGVVGCAMVFKSPFLAFGGILIAVSGLIVSVIDFYRKNPE